MTIIYNKKSDKMLAEIGLNACQKLANFFVGQNTAAVKPSLQPGDQTRTKQQMRGRVAHGLPRQGHDGARRFPAGADSTAARLLRAPEPAAPVQRRAVRQTLQGSFSAVLKRNFASKYSLESSRRDLHNALLCTAQKSHFLLKIARNLQKNKTIIKFFRIC